MSEKLRESLSAVMDGEADEFELRRVLDEIARDPELRAVWDRYHEASAALKGEHSVGSGELRERVWEALDGGQAGAGESVDAAPPVVGASPHPWWGRATGIAVAATVALAVVVGTGVVEFPGTGAPLDVVDAPPTLEGPSFQLRNEISPTDVRRVDARMMFHVQQRAMNRADLSSFAKFLTYEEGSQEE